MNERIKELAEQAGMLRDKCGLYHDARDPDDGVDLEAFAELIVRECLQTCKDVGIESKEVWNASKDYQEGRQMGAEVCHNMIKKHFGVE
jgi:hypothetical protein